MATIKEVAKACNVSIATVSNILNGKGRVGEETRQRILNTAKEMGYVPNMMAKNLKQRNTRMIGIITEDLTVFNCADIVDGIHEYLEQKGYTFLLGNLRLYKKYDNAFYHHERYHAEVEEEFRIMQSKQVAGVIYVGAHCREMKIIPGDYGVPIVVAYGFSTKKNTPSVIYDDEQAAYEAANELIRKGYRKIGLIAGESESRHTIDRQRGYQKALFENQILYNPELVQNGDWSRELGYQACEKLMKQGVDAIFSMSDVMAAGVYDYANEKGLCVGRDIGLIGFDNREISTAFNPELSTMALPLNEIGLKAADLLIRQIEEEDFCPEQVYKIECSLLKRQSE
ncbi:MAG: LacI family DNA-binding transcriptional regulator [Lachnospiraceae bacterium]